jgi:murein DD-endopeptidase MepM/ murein hydrolase activator NlpD
VVKDDNYAPFEALNPSFFSTFYDEIISPYHFVLFGMQWCQPVYDEFADAEEGIITNSSYIQDDEFKNLHMHLVTRASDLGGLDKYGGKGYGKVEVRANPYWRSVNVGTVDEAHLGLDIHAKIGDPVFAVRYGEVDNRPYSNTGGNIVRLSWSGTARNRIDYLHLLEAAPAEMDGEEVMPGTRLGLAGRTGNLGVNSSNPGHVHINVGADPEEIVRLRTVPDADNKIAIPFNETALLFPCAAQVTNVLGLSTAEINALSNTLAGRAQLAATARIPCQFDDTAHVGTCWAAAELKCPYIPTSGETDIKLQILLRYLNEKPGPAERLEAFEEDNNPQYLHPGGIDGDIGDAPGSIADSSLSAGTAVERLGDTRHDGKLIKIRYQIPDTTDTETTWIESSLLDDEDKLTEDLSNLVTGGSSVGTSRMAVYLFRKEHDLVDLEDYSSNFSADAEFWTALQQQTNLLP